MKIRIMKNNKNSCCKNNLCEYVVHAHIVFLSRIVKLSIHYSSPYLRRRLLSRLYIPQPAMASIIRSLLCVHESGAQLPG